MGPSGRWTFFPRSYIIVSGGGGGGGGVGGGGTECLILWVGTNNRGCVGFLGTR